MGSLWYHRHTICVSQGLTLSTASLVIIIIIKVSLKLAIPRALQGPVFSNRCKKGKVITNIKNSSSFVVIASKNLHLNSVLAVVGAGHLSWFLMIVKWLRFALVSF